MRLRHIAFTLALAVLRSSPDARAQTIGDEFFDHQAQTVNDLIVQAVEQAISNLPPTTPQAFQFVFHYGLGIDERRPTLGPIAFLSPETLTEGGYTLGLGVSYMKLRRNVSPTIFGAQFLDEQDSRVTKFGLSTTADVFLMSIGGAMALGDLIDPTGTLRDGLDLSLFVPVTVVDVSASTIFLSGHRSTDIVTIGGLSGLTAEEVLTRELSDQTIIERKTPFHRLRNQTTPEVREGPTVGLGRVRLAAKLSLQRLFDLDVVSPAFSLGFALPSPSESEYAGSASGSIFPRLVLALPIGELIKRDVLDGMNVRADVGYEYDFSVETLRRFVWDTGVSLSDRAFAFDFGVGGSKYAESLRWAPEISSVREPVEVDIRPRRDTSLGDNLVDFRVGLRWSLPWSSAVVEPLVFSGAATFPLTDDGIRSDATLTLSIQAYLRGDDG